MIGRKRLTYNLVGVHDGLQTMRDREESNVAAQLLAKRLLNDLIGLVICTTFPLSIVKLDEKRGNTPMAEVASSRMRSLL